MKMIAIAQINGSFGTFLLGDEFEVPDDVGEAWKEAGIAEPVDADVAPETATIEPPRNAMMPRARPRAGSGRAAPTSPSGDEGTRTEA